MNDKNKANSDETRITRANKGNDLRQKASYDGLVTLADAEAAVEAVRVVADQEMGRFQDEIRNRLIERYKLDASSIDGAGSDADEIEFTWAEIEQAIGQIEERLQAASFRGCPCLYTEPCDKQCSCVRPHSSRGCQRCCSYGSPAQQKAMAEIIVASSRSTDGERKREIERLRGVLERIIIEHNNYTGSGRYANGVADGLRCVATIAREALDAALFRPVEKEKLKQILAKCPNCAGVGWYATPDRRTGEPAQEQCQWCAEVSAIFSSQPTPDGQYDVLIAEARRQGTMDNISNDDPSPYFEATDRLLLRLANRALNRKRE